MTDLVTLDVSTGLATITLARPDAGNAMSWVLIDTFGRVVDAVVADPSVRAVLIAADGRQFCVGGDIRAFASEADPGDFVGRLAARLHESVLKLAELPVPVVVAVQGAAAGAGLSLVAGGDIVIAARSATFTMAYTGIGLTADGGATWFLPRVIGLRRTQELAYSGRRLTAVEAETYGLVTRVAEDDALAEDARETALTLAAGPTGAFGRIKRLLAQTGATSLADQLAQEVDAISAAMRGADAQQAVAAFLDRRRPFFQGR